MPPAAHPSPAALDIGNPLTQPVECQATATLLTSPGGGPQFLLLTIRTTSATLTVFLNRDQATTWRDLIDSKLAKMTTLDLPGQPDPLPFPAFPNGDQARGRM